MADESGQQQRSKRAKQPTERARLADEESAALVELIHHMRTCARLRLIV